MLKVPPWHLTVLFELYVHFGSKAAAASSIHNDGPPCVMRHIIQQDNRVDNAINRLSATLDNHYDPHLLHQPKKSCIDNAIHPPLENVFFVGPAYIIFECQHFHSKPKKSINQEKILSMIPRFHGHWWKMTFKDLNLSKSTKTVWIFHWSKILIRIYGVSYILR